jgi:hypothetical protein
MNKIILEPRLEEYMNRKRTLVKNNIKDNTLERSYNITKEDIKLIKSYRSERNSCKTILNTDIFGNFDGFIEVDVAEPKPSDTVVYDKRFERVQKKMQLDRDANNNRIDTSNLSRNYDLFGKTTFSSAIGHDTYNDFDEAFKRGTNLTQDNLVNSRDELNKSQFNPYFIQQPSNSTQSHYQPRIQYNQRVYNDEYDSYSKHQSSLDNIIGSVDTYRNKLEKDNNYNPNSQYNTKYNLNPNMSDDVLEANRLESNRCVLQSEYKAVPLMTGGDLKNIDIENYIKYGVPTSKAKSLGFENPVEHYFQYIDSDIQDPSHVVFDRPSLSRMSNKTSKGVGY